MSIVVDNNENESRKINWVSPYIYIHKDINIYNENNIKNIIYRFSKEKRTQFCIIKIWVLFIYITNYVNL